MDSNDKIQTESVDEPARKRIRPDPSPDNNPEETVGITQFLSNHDGFDGIIKYRYSDFLVNEISSDGSIVHLTDLSCPEFDQNKPNSLTDVPLSEEIIESLKTLSKTHGNNLISIPVDSLTKEQRTSIHHFVRSVDINLKSELINNSIQITYQPIAKQTRRSNEQWPDKTKPYLKFVLYKENRDTMDAIQSIAACLNMNTSLFQYAGIKDKRGKTCQEVTIHKVLPNKFKHINQRLSAVKVGNFELCQTPLRLGQLQGNRFEIFIRNVSIDSTEYIQTYVNNWIEKGYINYFGLQRFGSRTLATQTIGKYLLRHDWSLAIDAILAYDETISQEWLRNLLNQWNKTHDIKTILDGTSTYRRSIEVDLLRGLQKHGPTNLIGAL
jgi:tRNA pseudouridine13 synthase